MDVFGCYYVTYFNNEDSEFEGTIKNLQERIKELLEALEDAKKEINTLSGQLQEAYKERGIYREKAADRIQVIHDLRNNLQRKEAAIKQLELRLEEKNKGNS